MTDDVRMSGDGAGSPGQTLLQKYQFGARVPSNYRLISDTSVEPRIIAWGKESASRRKRMINSGSNGRQNLN